MESSRQRTRIIQRSKGAGTVALVVTLACAGFGVGGAAAGDGSYARHVREQRLAGEALAHRSPKQFVLAIKPKSSHVSMPPVASAAATTPPTASTTPATTTSAATPTETTPSPAPNATPAATTAQPATTTAAAAPANATTNTDTTTTGTTTTGTSTTTTTDTSTTDTSTSDTSTTDTPTTDTTSTSTTDTTGDDGTATPAQVIGNLSAACYGRCSTPPQTDGAVPASVPLTSSPGISPNFNVASASVSSAPPTPTAAVSSATVTMTSPAFPALTSPPPLVAPLKPGLGNSPFSPSVFLSVTRGRAPSRTGGVSPGSIAGGAGTALTSGGTAPAGATLVAAAPTPGGPASIIAPSIGRSTGTHHGAKNHGSSGPSSFTNPITSIANDVPRVVKWIPTAVWVGLGVAVALALTFAALAWRTTRRARKTEKEFLAISAAAQTDALTGIPNRRGFMEAAERELARASRYDRSFVVAYVDVRGLKAVNDTEGHLVGDELLKKVAALMKESARADDVVGRIGGDEFALLVAEQTAEGAEPVLRRIQARVEAHQAAMETRVPWELTIGIAAFPDDGGTLEELLGVADRRLYEQRGIALR